MDGATALISIISFSFQAFQGCVQAFQFFYTAQHIGIDGDILGAHLEFEKYRLISWAEKVGIEGNTFRRRNNLNWQMACMYLEQLRAFMTTTDQLKERYALDITIENIEGGENGLEDENIPNGGIGRLINKLKPNIYTISGKIIQGRNGTIKRLRWATRDKEKLRRFIDEIRTIINHLELLLDYEERKRSVLEQDLLMRGMISLSSSVTDVGQVMEVVGNVPRDNQHAIRAAASFKQIRLALGADKRSDEVKPASLLQIRTDMPKLRKLKRALKPWGDAGELRWAGLEFASYHGRQVLIQWKTAEGPEWVRYEEQMKCLAVLLMSINDESFWSPPCMGYYPAKDHAAHGIVYEIPADSVVDSEVKSLKDIMRTTPFVSLERRLEIALGLAETVLQLHTAGWMHKNLNSSNVVFFANDASDSHLFFESRPYLVGYDYARPDTADAAQKYTQLLDMDLEADLYRHPDARGTSREVYQKRFDMYAMACVLVELVTWKPLVEVMSTHTKINLQDELSKATERNEAVDIPSLWDLFQNKNAVDFLAFHTGPAVIDVIKMCASIERAKEGEDGLLREQMEAVKKLSWCRV